MKAAPAPWANAGLQTWWVITGDTFTNEIARVVKLGANDVPTFQLLPLPPGVPSEVGPDRITSGTRMAIVDGDSITREYRASTLLVDARRICEGIVQTAASATSQTHLKDLPGHEWLVDLIHQLEPFADALAELNRKADGQA